MKNGIKVAVIGGGSSYTPELVDGIIKRTDELPVRQLWLVDIEEGKEKLEIITGLARRMIQKREYQLKSFQHLSEGKQLKTQILL